MDDAELRMQVPRALLCMVVRNTQIDLHCPFCQDEGVLFLLVESQLVDERMMVYVNDLLASGEVPDL